MPESAAPVFTMSSPPLRSQKVGAELYNELLPLGRRKAVARTNSSGLLRLGHRAKGGPVGPDAK